MATADTLNTQYLEDKDGELAFVVLPIQEFESLKKDYNDLTIIHKLRDNERNPNLKLYKLLKKSEIISEYTNSYMEDLISIFWGSVGSNLKIKNKAPELFTTFIVQFI